MDMYQAKDTMVKKLVIIGSGSQGRMIAHLLEMYSLGYEFHGFLDDKFKVLTYENGILRGPIEIKDKLNASDLYFIIAVGDPKSRKQIFERINLPSNRFATIVHPEALIDPSVKLNYGNFIAAKTIISFNVEIQEQVFIQSGAVIEYDSQISSFVSISPNVTVCGNVKIYPEVFIGASATIIQGLKIGRNTIVGAGTTVIRDIEAYVVSVGSPARKIRDVQKGIFI